MELCSGSSLRGSVRDRRNSIFFGANSRYDGSFLSLFSRVARQREEENVVLKTVCNRPRFNEISRLQNMRERMPREVPVQELYATVRSMEFFEEISENDE